MKQALDLIKFSDWYGCDLYLLIQMDFRCKIFPLNYSSPQTVESSAREFLGNDNSSVLTSTVVWIINYRLVIQLILAEKKQIITGIQ